MSIDGMRLVLCHTSKANSYAIMAMDETENTDGQIAAVRSSLVDAISTLDRHVEERENGNSC